MTQNTSLDKVEQKLGLTSNLALENYSHTNIPGSKKELSQTNLIRSEFNSDPRVVGQTNAPPPLANTTAPNYSNMQRNLAATQKPPPVKSNNFLGLNFGRSKGQKNLPPVSFAPRNNNPLPPQNITAGIYSEQNYNQNPNYLPQNKLALPVPEEGKRIPSQQQLRGPPSNLMMNQPQEILKPGDFRFYSTVKEVVPQNYPQRGFDKIMEFDAITMRPILNIVEEASCTTNFHTFYVYPGQPSRAQYSMEPLFVVREITNTCARLCLNTDCRPFEVIVSHDIEGNQEFLHLERACNVNCCCLGRPEMVIDFTEEGLNQSFGLGGIFHPFVFCDYELEAYNDRGETLFMISAERCSCNIYCCFSCDSCNHSRFRVRTTSGMEIGQIEIGTHYQSCMPGTHECDYFSVNFHKMMPAEHRVLLFSAMIFISTRLFSRGCGTKTILE